MFNPDHNIPAPERVQAEHDNPPSYAALKFDPTAYMHHLDGSDLTEAQKAELLGTIWQIVVHFVDLGLGLSPLQAVLDNSQKSESPLAGRFSDVVKSDKNSKNNSKAKLRPAPKRQP